MIWTPDLLFSKPPRGSRLNPSHPLSRGLSEGWLVNEGTGPIYGLKHPGWCSKMEGGYWQGNNLHSAAGGGNAITWGGDEYTAVPCLSLAVGAKIHAMDPMLNMEYLVLVERPDSPSISYMYNTDSSSYVLAGNWGEKAYAITFSSSTPDLLGQYLQIVLVYGPGGYPFLYVNGEIPSDMDSNTTGPFSPPTIPLHNLMLLGFPSTYSMPQGHKELYYCYMWDRSLTEAEVKTLWQDPYCMVRRQPTDIGAFEYVVSGGTYVDLAGSINTPSQLTASLKRYIGMAGSANFTFSSENVLKATRKVQGTLETSGSLDGTTKVARGISGLINAKADMSLAIGFMVNLSGIIEAGGDAAGQIKIVKDISGNVSSTSLLAGVVKSFRGMDGNILIPSSLNGTSKATRNLIGASETVSDLAASLKPIRGISGVIDSRAEVAGFTSIFKTIIGAIASKANLSAALELSGTIEFSGSISTKGEMASNLQLNLSLSGEITTAPSLKGNIRTFKTLSGALETVASIIGDAMRIQGFSGDIASATSIEGYLVRDRVLSGAITSSIDANGKVKIILSFSGSMDSLASLIASLSTFIPSTLGNPIDVSIVSVSTQRELYSITIKRTLTEV